MLMANLKAVLQRPKVAASYSRNAFDRGFSPKVHYQLGGLTPFFGEQVIAGSHVKLNRSIFQRTAAVNTAAFPKVDTHCEFFYVPLRLLWSYWNDFKLNIQDYNSTYMVNWDQYGVVTPHNPVAVPKFDISYVHNEIVGWLRGQFTANSPSAHFNNKAAAVGANRILDGLGYGYAAPSETYLNTTTNFTVNAFKLLAYQKVYYDHFRNTAYESNDPTAYNADGTWTPNSAFDNPTLGKLLTYRYVNYRKDYFQSVYPALNYTASAPSGMSWQISNSVFYQLASVSSSYQGSYVGTSQDSGGQVRVDVPARDYVSPTVSSVQQIRAAFALDKLLRASAYAPKHVKDQFEARYGVKGVENGNESVRIGAFMNDIVFQEVTSMANTANSGSNLGEIGGKGVGYSGYGEDIEFTAKEDGIILGLIYSMPRTSYDSRRVMKWNAKESREDFFIPEYMDLGLQPLFQYENVFDPSSTPQINNIILGYQDRYMEYKCGIDVNHGLFNSGLALSDFVVHSNRSWQYGAVPSALYFKVKPYDMDSIFVQSTDSQDDTTDKFITYLDVKFIVNQNMSVHGQPRLGGLG